MAMLWSMRVATLLVLMVGAPALVSANLFGGGGYQHFTMGHTLGCGWGTKPAPVPGHCGAFQCVSHWFLGSSYAATCPYGTLYSVRAGHCVSPMAVTAQCSGLVPQFWHYF